ncbi:MAG: hypothetical protein GXP55_10475 [Deltaproteobacteria bacterium]|nr:hypothetical protein [Deltaproteobacteria bacterium]
MPLAFTQGQTPWGTLHATPSSLALGAAVLAGWYLSLWQLESTRRREFSLSYAAAWLGVATELFILHSVDAPQRLWPIAVTLAAVVGVALVSPRQALARRLDVFAPTLGVACGLMLVTGPSLPLTAATAITVAAILVPARVDGQRFLITCGALLALG